MVKRAWAGLVRHVDADGRLGYVQPVGADPRPATREMTHEYAMGLFLLAGEEMIKLVESGAIDGQANTSPTSDDTPEMAPDIRRFARGRYTTCVDYDTDIVGFVRRR